MAGSSNKDGVTVGDGEPLVTQAAAATAATLLPEYTWRNKQGFRSTFHIKMRLTQQ